MKIPELLLPAGNIESFYAALEGGADAVYLGLKHFNARVRAFNFSNQQLPVLLELAHKKSAKVYVTLNTVVKNKELPDLLNVLDFLNQVKPDAVIIQDWGVYYLIRSFFPKLTIHASTQMANHNSLGAGYSKQKGFDRVILAREMTLKEVELLHRKTGIETETFVHGALCYSFSGMCHFSSYINANGANRGLCSQICRRSFETGEESKFFYSLKDQQQIEHIPELIKAGISSFKVEGRLKSADYVYKVAGTYRMVIDDPGKMEEAQKILSTETGRPKTGYFLAGDLSDPFTPDDPGTGLYLGRIIAKDSSGFEFKSILKFESTFRIRIAGETNAEPVNINVNEYTCENGTVRVKSDADVQINDIVRLIGYTEKKFSSRLPSLKEEIKFGLSPEQKKHILNNFESGKFQKEGGLFLRIDSPELLQKLNLDYVDQCILAFSKKDIVAFDEAATSVQTDKAKIWFELPHFIAEGSIEEYQQICKRLEEKGFNRFFLNHVSQKLLLPKTATFAFTENVYAYNDSAAKFLQTEGGNYYTYPFENDSMNLESYRNKNGIVPVYFFPRLFISRMPVKIKEDEIIKDETGSRFKKTVIDGISYTVPEIPVSLLHRVNQLKQSGFKNFLVDLSFENAGHNRMKNVLKKFRNSEQVQPSTVFNYKRELR